jgi:hypothetical protein
VTASHVVTVRPWGAVCLTCGQVGKTRDLIAHAAETYLRRTS